MDISENKGIKLDAVLMTARQHCTNLQTLVFADNINFAKVSSNPVEATEENGLEYLKRLDIGGSFHAENVSFILRSTSLCNVQYLNLSNCFLDAAAITGLFNSHLIKTLEYLGLANCDLDAQSLPTLKIIKLQERQTKQSKKDDSDEDVKDDEDVKNVFYEPNLKLKMIDLRNNRFRAGRHQSLGSKPYLEKVLIFAWKDKDEKFPIDPSTVKV